jgi:anaerobic ribonucleoside-triphosphate reductase activating protein
MTAMRQHDLVLFLHLLLFPVYVLGPGTRIGLWFQGCSLRCPGCVSPESWERRPGSAVTVGHVTDRLRFLMERQPRPEGLTISGGEPLEQPEALAALLRNAQDIGLRDVLIYSGYRAETLTELHPDLKNLAAALVDGPFEIGNPTDSIWKGSENQRLFIWNEEFRSRYETWALGRTRSLQRAHNGGRILLVGIPRQEDAARLRNISLTSVEGG